MKTMLVPTDFSTNALSALVFAMDLAPVLGYELEAVHVYELGVEEDAAVKKALSDWMGSFLKKARKMASPGAAEPPGKTSLLQGLTEARLIDQSSRPDVGLMVMGAEGSGGIGKKWFGSVAETVARQARCPVLLVPEGQTFSGFHHIMFASDYQAVQPAILDLLTGFAAMFRASIHFVHVEKEGEASDYPKIKQQILDHLFRSGPPAFSFQVSSMQADDVSRGLEDYSIQNEIDLLVMVAAQRSFWETLFHQSQTRAMILQLKIPMLVTHLGD